MLKFAGQARKLICGDCSIFLRDQDTNFEKWDPYRGWARALPPTDTIVSFNYDLVVEQLVGQGNAKFVAYRPQVEAAEVAASRLFKLHGSVDWWTGRGASLPIEIDGIADQWVNRYGHQFAIATPGTTKKKLSAGGGLFEALWAAAGDAVRRADAIVFLGYRFPESDAISRSRFHEWIGENRQRDLCVHIVLGEPSSASRRVASLVKFAMRGRKPMAAHREVRFLGDSFGEVLDHGLFVQDFLSVFPREDLTIDSAAGFADVPTKRKPRKKA